VLITQNLRRAALLQPERTAVSCGEARRTWRETLERVRRLAGGLGRLGLAQGDRVAILGANSTAFWELYLAAPWARMIMVSLNTRWSAAEMSDALADCGAAALIADPDLLDLSLELRQANPAVSHLVTTGPADPRANASWEELARERPGVDDQAAPADDPAYLFYTGGTTGRAKGVMLSALNFYVAGLSSLHTAGVSDRSTFSISVPLFHMSGGGLVAAQLAAAGGADLIPRFEPRASMAAVERARATHVVWVPTMLTMLLASPEFGRHDLRSLERILYGSAPMPEAILARAMDAMPGVRFTQYYGMTELSGNATFLGPEVHEKPAPNPRLRSVGVAVPGVELKVVRPDGSMAKAEEIGEICVRGPTVTRGYWGQPEKTAEAIRDGWMHTGDLGRVDEDGYVFLADRLKDMIISGGENVYSTEVENALYKHPAVHECAVIGLPDETWGELVCAVVHPAEGASPTAEELAAHCRQYIGGYKIPRRIILTSEPLPKSAAGKILKTELRRLHATEASPES
jgi:long-chain acyl-CoA synthetase